MYTDTYTIRPRTGNNKSCHHVDFYIWNIHSLFLSADRLNYSLTPCTQRAHEINPTGIVVSSASLGHRMTDPAYFCLSWEGDCLVRSSVWALMHVLPPGGHQGPKSSSTDRWFISLVSLFLTLSGSPSLSRVSSLSCDMRWLFVVRCAGL